MNRIIAVLISSLLLSTLSLTLSAQTIISEGSSVTFKVGNMGFNNVEGTFEGMSGEVNFSASNPSSAEFNVCIGSESVNTDNKKRDEHLKKDDFFDIANYIDICFRSDKIEKTAIGYSATGELTIKGVTKEVTIPFTYENNTFEGHLTIDRTAYGLGPSGGFMVGKEVDIQIVCYTAG